MIIDGGHVTDSIAFGVDRIKPFGSAVHDNTNEHNDRG
jgi:hypothetical protein